MTALAELAKAARAAVAAHEERLEALEELLYRRLTSALTKARVHGTDFAAVAGYGYHDPAVAKLESALAAMLGTEDCLFRPQLVSGTHALALSLRALVVPGQPLLFPLGRPYDTLWPAVGWEGEGERSLLARGQPVTVLPFALGSDPARLAAAAPPGPGLAWLQRSMGYQLRPTVGVGRLRELIRVLHELGYMVVVDNCYGEWTQEVEPGHVGADLVVGSFLKNPGGGLAPYGAYVAGRRRLVSLVAEELFGLPLGRAVAPHEDLRPFFQGLYLSPHAVGQALRSAIYAAALFQGAGFAVEPAPEAERGCIVQAIHLPSREAVESFCGALQANSPVEADVRPAFGPMPGYRDPVILAGGTFVPGATLELSADAALRPPYRVTVQGGLSFAAARPALEAALAAVLS